MKDKPLMVSVYILTYQHVKYIQKAIDSVLMQKVNFTYDIVISDDCSTDGTQQILIGYKKKYPNKIKLNLNKKNIGALRNSNLVFKNCSGKYIAILEGDDFWNDINKLQIQIDFLENHQEYTACYHNVNIIGDDVIRCRFYKTTHCDIDNYKQYFNMIPTIASASLVMRNIFNEYNYYHYFTRTIYIGDRILHALLLKHGKIKYLDMKMSTYRYNISGNNSFSSLQHYIRLKDYINALKVQKTIVDDSSKTMVENIIKERENNLLDYYFENHLYKELAIYLFHELTWKDKYELIIYRLTK